MTTPYRRTARCPNCSYDIPLEDEFSQWVRNHPELDSQNGFAFPDKDLICHRFKSNFSRACQCFMFVEVKRGSESFSASQRDTLFMIDQMFRNDKTTPTKTARKHSACAPDEAYSIQPNRTLQKVKVKCLGYHLLRLSGRTPPESKTIQWDKSKITTDQLIQLLRFDIHPDTLEPFDLRKHHQTNPHPKLL